MIRLTSRFMSEDALIPSEPFVTPSHVLLLFIEMYAQRRVREVSLRSHDSCRSRRQTIIHTSTFPLMTLVCPAGGSDRPAGPEDDATGTFGLQRQYVALQTQVHAHQ